MFHNNYVWNEPVLKVPHDILAINNLFIYYIYYIYEKPFLFWI